MRAAMVREWTEFENIKLEYDVPPPPLGERQVRMDIKASAISIALTLFVTGRYQRKPPLPFVPGSEVAGIITEKIRSLKLKAPESTPEQRRALSAARRRLESE